MTPRQRVETALRHGCPDRVPFTIYPGRYFSPTDPPAFKALGMCEVQRLGVFRGHSPHCTFRDVECDENGHHYYRHEVHTPEGDLYTLREPHGITTWTKKHLFGGPEDYRALRCLLNDAVFTPCYEEVQKAQLAADPATVFRAGFGYEPLQELISSIFGTHNFCLEWMDRRDEVLRLYEIIVAKRREVYPLVARGPVWHANYGGNVIPEIVGLEHFRQYYIPHYNEAAAVMHEHGKLIGCHFDGNCRLFQEAIAASDLDYVEAFTPAPDTDLSLAEARAAWPNKVLWINYPSSVHLRTEPQIREFTQELMAQAEPLNGFLIGITEDVPEERIDGNYRTIMAAIEEYHAARERAPAKAKGKAPRRAHGR